MTTTAIPADSAMGRLAAIIHCKERDRENELYNSWVDQYDEDMVALEFNGYVECQKKFEELITEKSAKILDLGCGTGMFGERLKLMGYCNIYGMDANQVFIDKSLTRDVYTRVDTISLDQTRQAPYADGFFDAVVAISVIGPNSVDQDAMPEISRLIKPGGHLIAFMRKSRVEMERADFNVKAVFEKWVRDGLWERLPDVHAQFYGKVDGLANDDAAVIETTGVVVTLHKL